MSLIGRVTGSEITKNKNGAKNVLMLQVEVTEPDDIQSIQMLTQSGEDTRPAVDAKVIIATIGNSYKVAIGSDDGIEPTMLEGEKKLYSYENEAIKAFINLLKSGTIELNGNSDFLVRYNELLTAFNELKESLNTHITNYNAATYTIGGVGTTGTTSTPSTPSTADMTSSKVETIKVP